MAKRMRQASLLDHQERDRVLEFSQRLLRLSQPESDPVTEEVNKDKVII